MPVRCSTLIFFFFCGLTQGTRFGLPVWLSKNPASLKSIRDQLEAHEIPILTAIGNALFTGAFGVQESESLEKRTQISCHVLALREEFSIFSELGSTILSELETACATLVGPCPQVMSEELFLLCGRRVKLGIDVAVVKYITDAAGFYELAKVHDIEGILHKLTNSSIELAVIERVRTKAAEINWANSKFENFTSKCAHFFESKLIPLTKSLEAQVITLIADGQFKRPV